MSKASQEKGKRGERMLVHFLRSLGLDTKRGMVFLGQSDLIGLDGIHIECKFVEKLNVRVALAQAIEEAKKKKDGLPAVFWKTSRKEWVTVMRTEDFITIYKLARWRIDTEGENTELHEGQ
jgi:Holliday junction resolvase